MIRKIWSCFAITLQSTTNTYTYLGAILDPNLVQNTDFDNKYKKPSRKLGVLRKLMGYLTIEAAHLVYVWVAMLLLLSWDTFNFAIVVLTLPPSVKLSSKRKLHVFIVFILWGPNYLTPFLWFSDKQTLSHHSGSKLNYTLSDSFPLISQFLEVYLLWFLNRLNFFFF